MRFLFVDRILQLSKGEFIRGLKHITADDHYLTQSEGESKPHLMSSLIGESLGQLAAWNVMSFLNFTHRPVAGVVASVKVHRPAYLGETVLLESFIDSLDNAAVQYHSTARIHDEVVFSIEGALGPLLPMTDFIAEEDARCQFAEINRCGEWLPKNHLPMTSLSDTPRLSKLTFDALLNHEPGVSMTAIKYVTRAASYFPDHFPRKPILPMTVLLECKLNLAHEFLKHAGFQSSYHVQEMRRIKMNAFVPPGEVLVCYLSVKQQNEQEVVLSFRSEVDDKRVCVMELVLARQGG